MDSKVLNFGLALFFGGIGVGLLTIPTNPIVVWTCVIMCALNVIQFMVGIGNGNTRAIAVNKREYDVVKPIITAIRSGKLKVEVIDKDKDKDKDKDADL